MRLAVHRFGVAGNPIAVLLHGVTASHRSWWRVAPAVADAGWEVLAIDLRCHGASSCAGPIRGRDMAVDVRETLAAEVGTTRIDVLWGHSLGARTAMQLLAIEPDRARRAVLEDPPGRARGDRASSIAGWRREVALARSDPDAFVREQLEANPTWDERDARENAASVAECEVEPIADFFLAGYVEGAPDLVPLLRVPALLVLADAARSALADPDRAQTIAAMPDGTEVIELPGGHTLHRDLPDDYLRVTLGWLGAPRRW
jgi:pimeloyl-ACP methyl ester carboxylesterase